MANPWDIVDERPAAASGAAGVSAWTPVAEQPSGPFVPRDMPLGEGVKHAGGQLTRGINESLGDFVANLMRQFANVDPALGAVGRISQGFGGPSAAGAVDQAHGAYDRFFDTKAPPETTGGYIARGAGRVIGETLPMTAAVLTGGASLPVAAATSPVAATTVPRMVADTVLRSAANSPLATAFVDTIAAGGAGLAGNIADIESGKPRAEPLSRTAAEFAGASAPLIYGTVSPTALGVRAGKDLFNVVRGRPSEISEAATGIAGRARDAAQSKAREKVLGAVETRLQAPDAQAAAAQSAEVQAAVPGFQPTLAQRTDVPSLKRAQQGLESRMTGAGLNAATDLEAGNRAAIGKFAQEAAPSAPQGVAGDVLNNALEQRIAALEARLAQQQQLPETHTAATTASMPTTAPQGPADRVFDPKTAGEALRTQAGAERQQMGNQVGKLRADIDPEGRVQVDHNAIRIGINADTLRTAFGAEASDPIVTRMLRGGQESAVLGPDGKPVQQAMPPATLAETMDFASKLNAIQRRLLGMPIRTPQQDEQLTSVKLALNKTNAAIDSAVAATGDTAMADRLKGFRDFYRDEFVPRFQEGAVADLRAKDPAGKLKINAEDIPGKFFGPNSLTEADQFQRVFAGNKVAQDTMTDNALASMRDSLNGKPLTQEAIDAWKRKNARVLERVPEVRDAVDRINVADAEQRIATLASRRQTVLQSDLAKQVGREPDKMIDNALADPKLMRQVAKTARDGGPDSEAALKRMVWDRVLGTDGKIDPAKIDAVLKGNERSLNIALSPKHVADLRTISEAQKIQNRVPPPKGSGDTEALSPPDKFADVTGSGFNQLMNRFITVARGRSSATYEGTAAVGQFVKNLSEKQHDALLKEVLYDGRLANDLAVFIKTGQKPPRERARAYLLAIGVDSLDRDDGKSDK